VSQDPAEAAISIWKDGQAPTAADWSAAKKPAVKLELLRLSEVMGFTLDELKLNRRGGMSAAQRSKVWKFGLAPIFQGLTRLCTMLALLGILGFAIGTAAGIEVRQALDVRFLGVLFLIMIGASFRSMARMSKVIPDLWHGKVRYVHGRVFALQFDESTLETMGDGQNLDSDTGLLGFESKTAYVRQNPNRRYAIEVDGLRFPVSEGVHSTLSDDSMNFTIVRAYYLPRTQVLLALEPMVQIVPVAEKFRRLRA